jgi:hypothetical protein
MNNQYAITAGIGFLMTFAMSIWPRHCIDRFKRAVQNQGGDPNHHITFSEMKRLDPELYRKYMIAVWLWIPCAVIFAIGMLGIVFG